MTVPRARVNWTGAVVLLLAGVSICSGQAGVINTVAGNGNRGLSGDGGPATSAQIGGQAVNLAADNAGNFYFADVENARIRRVNPAGVITTLSTGSYNSVAVDAAGNLYATTGSAVRRISLAGVVTTIGGGQFPGFSGDGGPATSAAMSPNNVAVDGAGIVYIAESLNQRIRKIDTAGIITTIAGNGTQGFSGDGGPATAAQLALPQGIAADAAGNVYFVDGLNGRVRKISTSGIITTVAGNGSAFGVGENVPATSIGITSTYVAVDAAGNLYLTEPGTHRVRKVNTAGLLSTLAGGNGPGFSGDGGPATSARLFAPSSVASDASGNVWIADLNNYRIRKVSAGTTAAALTVTPATINFAYTIGGATPGNQTVALQSTGAALPYSLAIATASGGNWLNASPSVGTTPANLTILVNLPALTALTAGVYQGTITITSSVPGVAPQTITVRLTVTGTGGSGGITLNSVVNASGYQEKLSPGVVFVGFGTGMGPAAIAIANAPAYPDALAGTSITFTPAAGGAAITARMVYTVSGQIAAQLPSSTPPGSYLARVTYNGQTSAPLTVTVVPRSLGIATANSSGSGPVQATIGNVNGGVSLTRFTTGQVSFGGNNWTLSPAHPGDTLVLWGTGGGADAANDAGGSSGDQTAAGSFAVLVGGRRITPIYAGASAGYPGLWQVNFVLPPDLETGCSVPLQVTGGGELSNGVILPIAAPGQPACSDPRLPANLLAKLDAGGTITFAAFAVARTTDTTANVTQDSASGLIGRYTAAAWMLLNFGPRFGFCAVYDRSYAVNGLDPASPSMLDAGSRLPLSGPGLPGGFTLAATAIQLGSFYAGPLQAGSLAAGMYTLSAPGGSQVGPFAVSTNFPASFALTNFGSISTIDRRQPLTLNWTGSGVDRTVVTLSSSTRTGSTQRTVTVNCDIPGNLGSYAIPAAALAYLQPVSSSGDNLGSIAIYGQSQSSKISASLIGGGEVDLGGLVGNLGVSKNVAIQ